MVLAALDRPATIGLVEGRNQPVNLFLGCQHDILEEGLGRHISPRYISVYRYGI